MPRLSQSQWRSRQAAALAARTAVLPEPYAAAILSALALAVPSDDSRFFTIDPGSRLLNRLLHATATDGPHRARWLQSIYLTELSAVPYFAPQVLMDEGIAAMTYLPDQAHCHGITDRLREIVDSRTHRRVFFETVTPTGGSLRLLIGARGKPVGMVDLIRRDSQRPFTAGEFAFLRSLVPVVANGLLAALGRETALNHAAASSPGEDAAGVLILNAHGRLAFASRAGDLWLRRLTDSRREEHGPLPTVIWSAAAMLRHAPERAARVLAPIEGAQAQIEASSGQQPGEIVIVISRLTPPKPPAVVAEWPLTATERRVVELMVSGKRNREIAAALFVSEHTVEAHLSHVYEKLAVSGRGGLLARLFAEQFLDGFGRS